MASRSRWASAGEASFLLAPNLKDSRGALRDWHALRALSIAQLIDIPPAVRTARVALLSLRGELHRHVGRATDVLRQQDQGAVADRAVAGHAHLAREPPPRGGRAQPAGPRGDDADSMSGNAVMYDTGKILKVGGSPAYQESNATAAS